MKKIYKCCLLLFSFFHFLSYAQITSSVSELSLSPKEKYSIQTWTTENGLPQNSINDIVQTNDGYLWLATFDGLVRFDGLKFEVYNTSNTPEIKVNGVKRLFVDNKGYLWIICTDGNLISYYQKKFQQHILPSKVIIFNPSIGNWANNGIIVACENNKIYTISDNHYNDFSFPKNINKINTLISKYNDQLYIGTTSGVYSFINGKWNNYEILQGQDCIFFSRSPINDIIANVDNKLYLLHLQNADEIKLPISLKEFKSFFVGFDESQQMMLLTEKGLYVMNSETVENINTENGLSSKSITSAFVDKQNNLWVGTSNGGLNKLKTKFFKTIDSENGLSGDGVTGIIETQTKGILIENNCSGVSLYSKNTFSSLYKGLKGNCFWSVFEDEQKNIWFGTYGNGIIVIDENGKTKEYKKEQGLSGNVVFSIYQDSKKTIWVGTNEGLCYFEKNHFISFDSSYKNTITYIFEDRNKQLFLCSDIGLLIINGQQITPLKNSGLENINARYIYEDKDGVLWIGTHGSGLIRLKNGSAFSFYKKYIPLDINVWSISEDEQGNFWLPSNSGMYVVPKKELNDFADGFSKNINPSFLSKEDGLKSIEFNGGFQPTVLQTKTGEFWFPTVKGVAIINPKKIQTSSFNPQVVIENIIVEDKLLTFKDSISISSSVSSIVIKFTAPSFNNPSKINFQYKMEGIDNDWINLGDAREIKLSAIPYNTHLLRIRVAGTNDNKEANLVIIRTLPFWKETRFIISLIFTFILLTIIVTFIIIQIIQKREKTKTQLNKQYANIELKALQTQLNPHFIFNCLNSIQHFIVVNDEKSASKYLTKFSTLMRKFLEHSKFNKVSLQEEIELLSLYVELETLRSKNKFKFVLSVSPEVNVFNIEIPSMLFQPFVENAINHGLFYLERNGTLSISFKLENNSLVGYIEDDGVGRERSKILRSESHKEHFSRGMEIIKERIAILNYIENCNIEMEIFDKFGENNEPMGTIVTIKIPI